jgi:hypothetical protein
LALARAAHDRGDPLATITHARSAIALHWVGSHELRLETAVRLDDLALTVDATEHAPLLAKMEGVISAIAVGPQPDIAALVVLAPAALSLAVKICGAKPPIDPEAASESRA